MPCFWRTSDLAVLLIWGVFVAGGRRIQPALSSKEIKSNIRKAADELAWNSSPVPTTEGKEPRQECVYATSGFRCDVLETTVTFKRGTIVTKESSCMNGSQTSQNGSSPMIEANTTLIVQMGTKALLCCPAFPMTKTVLIMWVITPRGQPPCRISYRVDTKENNETNCTDRRITWAFTTDQYTELQINAVAVGHEGLYSCEIATPTGNFLRRHDLQVLVPPAVTLLPGENRTAVCEAIAGKPAAQIFWNPDGNHSTMQESHSNGTVTVRSTYHWEQNNVSAVFCFVSHPTGNQTLSIELNGSGGKALGLYTPYIISSPIILLIIIGCIWLLKISGFRKCRWTRPEASPAVEEDEMQPYASYTEKSNPLYDTVTKVEVCPASQGEVNGTDWLALSATGI